MGLIEKLKNRRRRLKNHLAAATLHPRKYPPDLAEIYARKINEINNQLKNL